MPKNMSKLINYKKRKENRYSTFSNVSFGSREAIDIKPPILHVNPKPTLKVYPQVHTAGKKQKNPKMTAPDNNNNRAKNDLQNCWRRNCCCHCCCLSCERFFQFIKSFCCCFCCNGIYRVSVDDEEDVDKAFEQYKQSMAANNETDNTKSPDSQRSTLKSEKEKGASRFWDWNESLKSNSDKFLDSLEFDSNPNDLSLKRRLKRSNVKVRMTAFSHDEGYFLCEKKLFN